MRGKHKKLQEWTKAGLLTEDQAQAIQTYENGKKAGRFGRGLMGLGIFAILVGVLSIIASNWHYIPGEVKIGVHVLLNALVGYAAFQSAKAGKDTWRDGYTLAFFGLTLTLIALIGQVFQLDGETAPALMLWMSITLPFMLIFANSYMSVAPWMAAFLTTLCMGLFYYGQDWTNYWQTVVGTAVYLLLPLLFMAKGSMPIFRAWKPVWADIFLKTGVCLTAGIATIAIVVMGYDRPDFTHDNSSEIRSALGMQRLICLIGFAGIFLHAAINKFYRHNEHLKLGGMFAAISLAVMALPIFFVSFYNPILAALLFIAYWAFIGWIGQQLDQQRLISLAIVLIAIRIFVIYCEVFGSLMSTGIGLIIGGGVMLGLIWGARRINKRLTGKGAV